MENAYRVYVVELRPAGLFYLFTGFHGILFWIGLIIIGCAVPMWVLFHPRTGKSVPWIVFASSLVIFGVLCERYVIVLPGLNHPPELLPGWKIVESAVQEGVVAYSVSAVEMVQALGVFGVIACMFLLGLKFLPLLPTEARVLAPAAPAEEPVGKKMAGAQA
jgi:molybdopterin-containing oxidoreductase family membrane subunit